MVRPKLESNVLHLVGASLVTNAALFLVNILLANRLSPGEYGTFTLMFSIVTMYIAASELGISQGTIKFVSERLSLGRKDEVKDHVTTFLAVTVAVTCGFLALFYMTLPLWVHGYPAITKAQLAFLALAILPYPVVRYLNGVTDGYQRMGYAFTFALVREPVKLLLLLLAALLAALTVTMTVIVFVVSAYLTLLGSLCIYRTFARQEALPLFASPKGPVIFDRQKAGYFLSLYVTFLVFWTYPNILYLLVGRHLNPEAVAGFSVSYMLNSVVWVLLLPLLDSLFPFVSSLFRHEAQLRLEFGKVSRLLWAAMAILFLWVLGTHFFGTLLLARIYGRSYGNYGPILYLLALAAYFEGFRVVLDPILKGTRHAKGLLVVEAGRVATVVLCAPLFIGGSLVSFGWLLVAASGLTSLVKTFLAWRLLGLNLFFPCACAAAAMMVFHFLR